MTAEGCRSLIMDALMVLRRTALAAVLLFAVACGGGDSFEPAPGASVQESDLEALVREVVHRFDLQWSNAWAYPSPEEMANRPSCFEVESGPCSIPRAPGLAVALYREDSADVLVRVTLGIDMEEAGDLQRAGVTSRRHVESRLLRVLYEPASELGSMPSGPCDRDADRAADEGCAWQERGAPKVGDRVAAIKSDSLERGGMSAVVFSRGHIAVDIEVIEAGSGPPDRLADDLAKALDEQIKLALSR